MGQKLTTEEYKEQIKDKSVICLGEYINGGIKISHQCKKCFYVWDIRPSAVKQGQGCPECAHESRRMTKTTFLKLAQEKYIDKFEYLLNTFISYREKVSIICPEHGKVNIFPKRFLNKNNTLGCPKCVEINRIKQKRLPLNKFIDDCNNIHNNKYDYSKVTYTSTHDNITINCPKHGEFIQRAYHHKGGSGCQRCYLETKTSSWPRKTYEGKKATLYYVKLNKQYYKIGLTKSSIDKRFKGDKTVIVDIIDTKEYEDGGDAWDMEIAIKKTFMRDRYYGEKILTGGNSEIYNRDILGLDDAFNEV